MKILWKILKIATGAVFGMIVLYVAIMVWIGSSRELVGGYYLHNLGNANNITVGQSSEVIEPDVTQIGEYSPYILGYREQTYTYMDSFIRPEGYFIIDTRDGALHTSLTRAEFIQELQRLGISSDPPETLLRQARIAF